LGSESNHSEKQPDEDIGGLSDFDDMYEDANHRSGNADPMVNPMYNEEGGLHTNAMNGAPEQQVERAAAVRAIKKKKKSERKKMSKTKDIYSEANEAGGYYDDNNQWHNGLFGPDGTFYPGYYDDDDNWVDLEEASFSLADFTGEQGDFSYTNSAAGQGYEYEGQGEGGAEAGYYEGGEGYENEGYNQNDDYYNYEYSNEERGSEMVSMQAGSTHNPMTDDKVPTQYAVDDDAV
jgi:hypothetical protein